MLELTVKIKDSDRKYSRSFPIPVDMLSLDTNSGFIGECIAKALLDFDSENPVPDSVRIVIKSEDL